MEIRELTKDEIEQVNGGFGFIGGVPGAVAGGYLGYRSNGWRGAVVGAGFGFAVGFTGGLAAASTDFMRLAWSARSTMLTVAGGGLQDDTRRFR